MPDICDPTPRNESLCAFEKSEKKGKVKKTNCDTCYNINADWHTFFLEAIAFPLF
jgi:hypothetical protein